ncbi:L,D-transpeptidase [Brucella pseudogrignonensis]|uniref:L,D-transpeptidase n=1 Tax=Brucella pseudogrignonensis TaxID=419475 RepID=UPI003D95D140
MQLSLVLAICATISISGCSSKPSNKAISEINFNTSLENLEFDTSSPRFTPPVKDPAILYREISDQGRTIAAVKLKEMKPSHIRQMVDYRTDEVPGSIVVDQNNHFLYFVIPKGKAIRYAIGVGPAALGFTEGDAVIDRKQEWPRWIPTASMVARSPEHYGRYKKGLDGGLSNPLGARALYMQKNGKDTYYRVHGTNRPKSIGKSVSAGCIRLLNQDIIDLYKRVKIGARIVVL